MKVDVDRLTAAIHRTTTRGGYMADCRKCHDDALRIAAEYDRLQPRHKPVTDLKEYHR